MARPLSKQELERRAVDFPISTQDEPYQTTSDRFKNIQADRLTNPTRETSDRAERIAQRQAELEEFQRAALYQQSLATARAYDGEIELAALAENTRGYSTSQNAIESAAAVAKNAPAAMWMTAWHTWFWLMFQVPLATISLAFIGLQAAVEGSWLGRLFQGVMGVINGAARIFGGDFSLLTPINIALALHFLVFGLSMLGLIGTIMLYAVRGQHPLGGDRSGSKFAALLLCCIGYSAPVLNLFPWIGYYIYVMWRSRS